jgi:hypothetical protein
MALKPGSEDDGAVSSHKTEPLGIQRQASTITVCRLFGFVTDIGSRPLLLFGYSGCIFFLWLGRGRRLCRRFGRWESRSFPAIAERCYRGSKTKE